MGVADAGSKAAIRRAVRQRMLGLAPMRRAMEEELVTARVLASPEWAQARTVALYHAVAPELSVASLANAAWRDGRRTAFPRVEGATLAWHEVHAWSQFSPGAFGIPEPPERLDRVGPHEVDLWVVPGVAFTAHGGRLGRGGGFYDRALGDRRPASPVFGVAFTVQVLDALPLEPHDLRVDQVVTMAGL